MKNLLKSLIVWLLFAAIPFQGLAAASMRSCAPMAAVHCGTHAASMQGGQHHAGAIGAASVGPGLDHAADTSSHHHAGNKSAAKCQTCVYCGVGAVMAPASLTAPLAGATCGLTHGALRVGHLPAVDLDLPERPPKTSLI